jgi:internalin A
VQMFCDDSGIRPWPGSWVGVLLGLVVALAGCSSGDPVDRPPGSSAVGGRVPTMPAAGDDAPAITQQQLVHSVLKGTAAEGADAAWIAAVRRVDELGGSFEFDAEGRLVGVDLVSGRVSIMGDDLQHLTALKDLVRLQVSSGDAGNPEVAALANLSRLRELALRNSKIDAEGVRQLSALRHLVSLDLQRSVNLRDEAFAVLADFPKLEELVLVEGVFSDAALDHLQRLPHLQRLDLRSCSGLTAAGFERLAQFGKLRVLKVGGAGIDDATLPLLAKITTLSSLTIEDASITDSGLVQLTRLPLEELSLARCFGITDAAFATIGQLSRLRQLYVRDILISGSGLGQLAPLTGLATLRLRQTGVGDNVLDRLSLLPALRRLELAQAWITDEGLASIGQLSGLHHLDLEDNRLSDEGVRHLGRLTELQRLSLAQNEAVTDAALDVLERLPKLRELNLHGTSISGPALDAFQARLPDCRIVR